MTTTTATRTARKIARNMTSFERSHYAEHRAAIVAAYEIDAATADALAIELARRAR